MKATTADTGLDSIPNTKPAKPKEDYWSLCGNWCSFPKVPSLMQNINTDVYSGRVKIEGKIFRESLWVNIFTNAKLLLPD